MSEHVKWLYYAFLKDDWKWRWWNDKDFWLYAHEYSIHIDDDKPRIKQMVRLLKKEAK